MWVTKKDLEQIRKWYTRQGTWEGIVKICSAMIKLLPMNKSFDKIKDWLRMMKDQAEYGIHRGARPKDIANLVKHGLKYGD